MGAADHQEGMKGKHKHKNFQHAFALLLSFSFPSLFPFFLSLLVLHFPRFLGHPGVPCRSPPLLDSLFYTQYHRLYLLLSTNFFTLRVAPPHGYPCTLLSLFVHQHPRSPPPPPHNFPLESYYVVRMACCTVVLLSVDTTRPAYKTTHVGIRIAVPL